MFDNTEIHMNDPYFLLFNLDRRHDYITFYIHPEFSRLPSFNTSQEFIWFVSVAKDIGYWEWIGHPEALMGIGRPSHAIIKKLFKYGRNNNLLFNHFEIVPINIPTSIRRGNLFYYDKDIDSFFV